MSNYYYITYETSVTMTAKISANSKEEAISLLEEDEYEDSWENYSCGIRILDIKYDE